MVDCCGVRFVHTFSKKRPNFQNGQKNRENRTNIDIILSFLAKPVDKHGITLVHITYPPLRASGVLNSHKLRIQQIIIQYTQRVHTTCMVSKPLLQNIR